MVPVKERLRLSQHNFKETILIFWTQIVNRQYTAAENTNIRCVLPL